MRSLAVVCMLLESELLGMYVLSMNMFVTCMHRALIFNCAGSEIVGLAVVMILQPSIKIVCIVLSIAICDTFH